MKWKAHDETSVANLVQRPRSMQTNSKMLSNEVHGNVLVSIGASDNNIFEWDLRKISEPKINRRYVGPTCKMMPHPSAHRIDGVFDPSGNFLLTAAGTSRALLYKRMRKSPVQWLGGHNGAVVAVDCDKSAQSASA